MNTRAVGCAGLVAAALVGCANDSAGPNAVTTRPKAAPTRLSAIAAGENFTCALNDSGAAYCWGEDIALRPTAVSGDLRFTTLAGGGGAIVGLTTAGLVYGFGWSPNRLDPHAEAEGWTFRSVATTLDHMCGVAVVGGAVCWGSDWWGQLGDSAMSDPERYRDAPVAVWGSLGLTDLTTGTWHSCGLTSAGAAYCWGHNLNGELGTGGDTGPCPWIDIFGQPYPCSTIPLPVAGGRSFLSLTAGFLFTCGLTTARAAYCWGEGSGPCDSCEPEIPNPLLGDLQFVTITAGWMHACGLTDTGTAYCWGDTEYGKLGDGSKFGDGATPQFSPPVAVSGGLQFKAIAPGWQHTCALTTDEIAYCWGDNTFGELGNGSSTSSLIPVPVASF